ncbi:hypothetical protein BKM31_15860 [[Actinomadura] parvosata subsp. kistnae]|uniref:Uncharacterized protein n=1 Tax=[Actinomadura] parvosata subsp. kistnae TaxID=1909395 RepID=A0A1U9ZXQ3_9ACTN|nr:hypothetical protein BKM31_15860 [Nonomuraea sp. ATCC 55076]
MSGDHPGTRPDYTRRPPLSGLVRLSASLANLTVAINRCGQSLRSLHRTFRHLDLRSTVEPGLRDTIRDAVPDRSAISDEHIDKIAQAVAARAQAQALLDRPRQHRREWWLLLVGLVAGALVSVPIGIWINHIS